MRSLCRQLLMSSFAAAIVSSTVHAAEPFYTDKAFLASIHPDARAQFVALNNTSAPQLSHSNLPLVPSSAAVKTNTKDKAAAMVLPPLAKDELAANKQTPLTSIEFKDEVLKQCILTQAAAMHQVIYAEQMRNIWCTGVTDLTGIENFTNLEIIELIGSPWEDKVLSDLSKLATFTALRRLDLSSNRLTDAQFATLKGAMFQQQDQEMMLRVYNNALTAASIPLIKELITSTAPIKYLDVTQNNFKTLQGIETLSDITQLHIGSNPFTDVVTEINRFSSLPALNEFFIKSLAIDDTVASKLHFAPTVTRLLLDFNPITHLDHILAKLNLDNLELISLFAAQSLRDASALVNATNLKILAIAYAPLESFEFLDKLNKLNSLFMPETRLTDISFLKDMPDLTYLYLQENDNIPCLQLVEYKEKYKNISAYYPRLCKTEDLTAWQLDSFNGNKVLDVTLQNQQGSVQFADGVLTFQPAPELTGWQYIFLLIRTEGGMAFPYTLYTAIDNMSTPLADLQFKDDVLKQCVLETAARNNYVFAEQLTTLFCIGVEDAAGIEQLASLRYLGLTGTLDENAIAKRLINLSPILNLKKLTGLSLASNALTDSQLATLNGLTLNAGLTETAYLDLMGNRFTSAAIPTITSILPSSNWVGLNIIDNRFSHFAGLQGLKYNWLHLGYNPLIDPVKEVSRFADSVVRTLTIPGLGLTTIDSIVFPVELYGLDISANPIESIKNLVNKLDQSALGYLNLSFTKIKYANVLQFFPLLNQLQLNDVKLDSYLFLAKLPKLQTLGLVNSGIINISSLFNLKELIYVSLFNNSYLLCSDIDALSVSNAKLQVDAPFICRLENSTFQLTHVHGNKVLSLVAEQSSPNLSWVDGVLTYSAEAETSGWVVLPLVVNTASGKFHLNLNVFVANKADNNTGKRKSLPAWLLIKVLDESN